jgi:hypothetical protein
MGRSKPSTPTASSLGIDRMRVAKTTLASTKGAPRGARFHGVVKLVTDPSLIVMNAHGGSLQDQTLTLSDVSTNSTVWANRYSEGVRPSAHR